jgi:hypothetical protein
MVARRSPRTLRTVRDSCVVIIRAWNTDHGIVVRILSSDPARGSPDAEHVVGSVGEACDVVRRMLEPLTMPATDR